MKRLALLVAALWPLAVLAQFGPFDRPTINADNFTARDGITLGGEKRTNWPSGGAGSSSITTQDVNGLVNSNVDARSYVTASVTNGLLTINSAASAYQPIGSYAGLDITNGLLTIAGAAAAYQPIGAYLAPGDTNGFVYAGVTNGLQIAGAYVTESITNGLLTISTAAATYQPAGAYLTTAATNGFVTAVVTNGLLTIASAASTYQPIGVYLGLSATNGLVTASVTNGLATGAAVALKADSNKTVAVAINGVTNSVIVGLGGVIDLGTLATVTGSVSYASNAGSLNGIAGGSYALTNQLPSKISTGATLTVTGGTFTPGATATNLGTLTIGPSAAWMPMVKLADWATPYVGATANSNAVAPIWVYTRNVTNSTMAIGDSSSQSLLQDAYRFVDGITPPLGSSAWGGATTDVIVTIPVWSSTNAPTFCKRDVRVVTPSGVIYATNNLVGGNSDWVIYQITAASWPSFEVATLTNAWRIETTAYVKSGHTNALGPILWRVK